ncbi:nitrogenase (molybdenum-iron) subunit alpha [Klebsiella michiganensis]|uniref:Nitrogenase (Molybdenum-iron) subunit alpha n=1 Tax=Klebsiella michiganensis TaxID=1134687 RepID=A0A7H4PJC4_9ENTR|nr:nitrogenase (molybdenum-iron) subunit alpha [Klebsiella michiganensis]
MGLRVVAQWSGDGTLVEMENTPFVKLNLVHCYRSMNYIARHMEEKTSDSVDGVQLLRADQNRRIAAQNRRSV